MIEVGAPITTMLAVTDSGAGNIATTVVRTTVATVFELALRPGFRWAVGKQFITANITLAALGGWDCFFDEEHVTWVRGWPELDSPEVAALLVAEALGPGAIPSYDLADIRSEDYEL